MPITGAYLGVILIWSTTPLAIQWSGAGAGFLFGVTGRMVIGTLLCLTLLCTLRMPLPRHRAALITYVAAGLGIFGAMSVVHWAAQRIPSGLISVLFGLTPPVNAVLAGRWLGERTMTPHKLAGMLAGLLGLACIFGAGSISRAAVQGILGVLVSVLVHTASTIWIKRIGAPIAAFAVTTGGLLVATPLFLTTWWAFDGVLPQSLDARAAGSILYLGLFGSVLGMMLYYHALLHLDTGRIALITLVTPVTALWLGRMLNGERVGPEVWLGTLLILAGLGLHQWQALRALWAGGPRSTPPAARAPGPAGRERARSPWVGASVRAGCAPPTRCGRSSPPGSAPRCRPAAPRHARPATARGWRQAPRPAARVPRYPPG